MQNYSAPFPHSSNLNATATSTFGSGSEAYLASSPSSSRLNHQNGDVEIGLDWSSRNATSQHHQQHHIQHQLQRARAANTLTSLSHTRGQGGQEAAIEATYSNRDSTRKRPESGHSDGSTSRRQGQGLASGFVHADEYDEDDELGGGRPSSSSSRYTYINHSKSHSDASNRPHSQPYPSGTEGDSGEAKEMAGGGGGGGNTRKQNSACDACRNRKVRCHRVAGEEKCAHCKTKGIECTTVFVQLASSGSKRPGKRARHSTEGATDIIPQQPESSTSALIRYLILRDAEYPNAIQGLSYTLYHGEEQRAQLPTTAESRLLHATARLDFVSDLIGTYFSIVHTRYPILDAADFRRRFHDPSAENGGPPADVLVAVILAWGAKFSENPIILADRREGAHQLTPTQKKKREAATSLNSAAHVATAAPVQGDAQERQRQLARHSADQYRVIGRSRIAEDLVIKAQEVLDRNKVHRISSLDNIRAALIVEALFWRPSYDSVGGKDELGVNPNPRKRRGLYVCDGAWVSSAIWHLKELQVHRQETIERISNPIQRPLVAMCWWLACMMDAHMSAFYRRKPYLAQEDYTTNLPAPPPAPEQEGPHPLASEQGYQIWLTSSQQQVEMMRLVYPTLWDPQTAIHGVSESKLEKLVSIALAWRENHLALVGAPSPTWPSTWNFADAVTACASDMNYHIVWILMWEAVEEFGIAELKVVPKTEGKDEVDQSKIIELKDSIYTEALNGSLRCANLSQVLCDNFYLRLEAGIMRWSMAEAGFCLTKFKRPEVKSIIEALRQYGQAFEECYDQANELEQLANEYLSATEIAHTSSVSLYNGNAVTPFPSQQLTPSQIPATAGRGVPNEIYNNYSLPTKSMAQYQQRQLQQPTNTSTFILNGAGLSASHQSTNLV